MIPFLHEIKAATAEAKSRANWLAPERVSFPNRRTLHEIKPINTIIGIMDCNRVGGLIVLLLMCRFLLAGVFGLISNS